MEPRGYTSSDVDGSVEASMEASIKEAEASTEEAEAMVALVSAPAMVLALVSASGGVHRRKRWAMVGGMREPRLTRALESRSGGTMSSADLSTLVAPTSACGVGRRMGWRGEYGGEANGVGRRMG